MNFFGKFSSALMWMCLVLSIPEEVFGVNALTNVSQAARARRSLTLDEKYEASWLVGSGVITFTLTVQTLGFIGFGISQNGGMSGSDIISVGIHPNGTGYIQDRHGIGNTEPPLDASQDYFFISGFENGTHTSVTFARKLNTCDDQDVTITDDTLRIIWAYSSSNSDSITYHEMNRGTASVNFLDLQPVQPDLSIYKKWRAVTTISLPPNDTIYWCSFHKAPVLTKKHHIVGFSMWAKDAEAKKRTHHADLYKCQAPSGVNENEYFGKHVGKDGYNCFFPTEKFPLEHCEIYQFQWAVGGEVTMFPDHVGIPFGESPNEYYMTEVHYDNPELHTDLRLESGLEIYYTDDLRKHDAGFLRVGVLTLKSYSITIPPMSTKFVVSSHCVGGCTKWLPEGGANVFNYQLHSHLSGRKIKLRHFRGDKELPWFANDDYYDFNYQNNRDLIEEKKVLPGDQLTVECTYNTEWSNGLAILGGPSTRQEMCKAFLLYYPRVTPVNNCGSYFPQVEMLKILGITNVTLPENEIDPTVWEPVEHYGKMYSNVVAGMNWTMERRRQFQELTRYGTHDSYCHPIDGNFSVPVGYPEVAKTSPYIPPEPSCNGAASTVASQRWIIFEIIFGLSIFIYWG